MRISDWSSDVCSSDLIDKPGRATADVLAEAIPAIVRAFAWPKSMRWGRESASSESLRWVRPLSGIVAIFGEDLIPCEVSGISAGYATHGHRSHCPGEITIGAAADYAEPVRMSPGQWKRRPYKNNQ